MAGGTLASSGDGPPRGEDFERIYREGLPPWDLERPQPAFAALAEAGGLQGRVLDAGCGTGEHALMAAGLGLAATGIDLSQTAIARAQARAEQRGLAVRFVVGDALALEDLGERYDTVLDCGLLHVLDEDERGRYVRALETVLRPGGAVHLLEFSDRVAGDFGPHRFTEDELRATFADWTVESLERDTIHVRFTPDGVPAWRATFRLPGA